MELCFKAEGLSKSFGALSVLEDWNLEVPQGERLALIGPSGCGKTTFLRILARLEKPTRGVLHVQCRKAGYVFQEPRLIPWKTAKDNLLFVSPNGACREMLDQLGLAGFEEHFPAQLSGGMAQRVNLARALLTEPDLLILDEAFFALDLGIKYKTMRVLMNLWEQRKFTLICVTHDLKDALLLSDRILILSGQPARITDEYHVNRRNDISFMSTDLFRMEAELMQKVLV
jgi:NitT/TauT family transport system ATP-binding protein